MKNKVFTLSYGNFTANKLLLTLPQNYKEFNPETQNYDNLIEYNPEVIRIINNSDTSLFYNIFDNDKELSDYNRDNTNLFDHLEIPSLTREILRSLAKNKYINFYVTGAFTGNIKIEILDYKLKG